MQEAAWAFVPRLDYVHSVSVPWRPSTSHGLGLEQAEVAGVWVGRRLRSHQFPALCPTDHGF